MRSFLGPDGSSHGVEWFSDCFVYLSRVGGNTDLSTSYAFNPMLCVTINGQILRRRVFVLDVTRGVMSVTKSTGFAASLMRPVCRYRRIYIFGVYIPMVKRIISRRVEVPTIIKYVRSKLNTGIELRKIPTHI